jgi:UDP-2,3-diacylglucosamine pyrophosphatase LpxH
VHERQIRVVVSDFHMGTGSPRGSFNPYEDFHEDDRFAELLAYYTSGEYDEAHVELVLNGDILDLLKVRVGGIWPDAITETIATEKVKQCLNGHPTAFDALRDFLRRGRTRITYIPGNHDIEFMLPGPQAEFVARIAGEAERHRVQFVTRGESYHLPEGIQIRHGHQWEAIHRFDYRTLTVSRSGREPVLNLPWGSLFVLKVLNPAKMERYLIDHVIPLRRLMLGGLFLDFRFTVKTIFRTIYHFIRTRFSPHGNILRRFVDTLRIMRDEFSPLDDYDRQAMRTLRRTQGVHTIITGHSHGARCRVLENGKLYINTGSWVRILNLDLAHFGQDAGLTYATVELIDGREPHTALRRWYGSHQLTRTLEYHG